MPPTIGYRFSDVVLVPFTDQTGIKKRPAIVSSQAYQQRRRDLIVAAVTGQIRSADSRALRSFE